MNTNNDSAASEQSAPAEQNKIQLASPTAGNRSRRLGGLIATSLLAALALGVFAKGDALGQVPPLQIIGLAQGYSPDNNVVLHAKGPSDVLQTQLIFQAGAETGWHTHPGPVIVVVATGALTEVHSDGCTTVHPAGSVFFEDAGVVHNAVNQTGGVTQLYATFLSPTGSNPLIPAANPGAVCRN